MARRERGGQGPGSFGILLIDKPAGPTSHDIVGWVRWALRERAVGHCGTLDPGATGLLVVCVGPATKLVEHLTGVDKRYLGRFVLGRATTTADADGETLAEAPLAPGDLDRASAQLDALLGPLELPPPAFSAVKIAGQRAHTLARAGEAPELPPRAMAVHELVQVARGDDWIEADLRVAKGTYVRSLAEELGRRLAIPAHLGALRRLACGDLSLEHPLAVTGLVAERLPDRPGAEGLAPRWRVSLGPAFGHAGAALGPADAERNATEGPSDARAQAEQALRDRLLPPWTCLPFPSSVLPAPGSSPGSSTEPPPEPEPAAWTPLIERLVQGQRLADNPDNCAVLGLGERGDSEFCALVDRAGGRMILVRRELAEQRLAPIRVLRFAPTMPFDH
jgi:tRNA pseudouridine(55) synthase